MYGSENATGSGRAGARRVPVLGSLLLAALFAVGGTAVAVPPPPPNPSDSELEASRDRAGNRADEVGRLANQLAEAEAELTDLRNAVATKMELAKKALVDMRRAQDAADGAEQDAESAAAAAKAAAEEITRARQHLDKFVANSYQQGSTVGSISAYLGSGSPRELLAREQLLGSIAESRLNALEGMQRAQTTKANKDSAARKALEVARQKQAAAEQAKQAADAARETAIEAQQAQAARTQEAEANKAQAQQALYQARATVNGLEGQRERYEDWQARKRAEERERARQAALANSGGSAASPGSGGSGQAQPPAAPSSASIETVIARAKSQLGMPYAWGGGNAYGPTRGIRDGGVADAHGDYMKVGFDCSGLMTYAFAPVRIIPSYSGYQYNAGRKVPLSQMRRGDMLFWGPGGGTHVALYLGNGMMIEAPYSGSHVRIAPVRYGGIAPYAVRIIG